MCKECELPWHTYGSPSWPCFACWSLSIVLIPLFHSICWQVWKLSSFTWIFTTRFKRMQPLDPCPASFCSSLFFFLFPLCNCPVLRCQHRVKGVFIGHYFPTAASLQLLRPYAHSTTLSIYFAGFMAGVCLNKSFHFFLRKFIYFNQLHAPSPPHTPYFLDALYNSRENPL